jgi:hypothetical protein
MKDAKDKTQRGAPPPGPAPTGFPEEELGSPDATYSIHGSGARQGTDADLSGAAGAIDRDPQVQAVGGFSASKVLLSTVCAMVIAPPSSIGGSGADAKPLTPQERAEGFIQLSGTILEAVDFDGNVIALLEQSGVGANLSPTVAIAIGCVSIAAAAFLYRPPKAPKPAPQKFAQPAVA